MCGLDKVRVEVYLRCRGGSQVIDSVGASQLRPDVESHLFENHERWGNRFFNGSRESRLGQPPINCNSGGSTRLFPYFRIFVSYPSQL